MQISDNVRQKTAIHKPPVSQEGLAAIAGKYVTEFNTGAQQVLNQLGKYLAALAAVQPSVRAEILRLYFDFGWVSTEPTEKGNAEIDVLSPDYDVKRLNKEKVHSFLKDDDRFLRIEEHVRQGNLKRVIQIDQAQIENLKEKWEPWWVGRGGPYEQDKWSQARKTFLDSFINEELPKFQQEVIDTLVEKAQEAVLKQCEQKFRQLLMTSPSEGARIADNRGKERTGVMGLVLEKYDRNNGIVTVSVVDHEGDFKAYKEMTSLLLHARRPKAEG